MLAKAKQKIALLDDDSSFLDVIFYYFREKFNSSVLINTFTKSSDFIFYISEHCFLPDNPTDILNAFYSSKKTDSFVYKTLRDLSDLSALLILDQHLRGEAQSGILLSKQIREYFPSSFITILSSKIGQETAIQLHNDNLIDLFVHKDSNNAMDYLHAHLLEQLTLHEKTFEYDPEDAFGYETILTEKRYLSEKNNLLLNNEYTSFLTINHDGDISILTSNNLVKTFTYNNKQEKFTSNDR